MVFVFFMLSFIPKCLLSSLILLADIWSSLSLSVVIFVYLRLHIIIPPIETPLSSFSITRFSSVKRLTRYGDSTHPCLLFLITSISSVCTNASCFQYNLVIILTSFPSNPAISDFSINF